jgi:glycosyltransferase involved in cell wall biosynthesis
LRVVIVNKYVRITGGADLHCAWLAELLRERGHEVAFLSTANDENTERGGIFVRETVTHVTRDEIRIRARPEVLVRSLWNGEAAQGMDDLLTSFRPDVVHAHKLYPQLSVAPIAVARRRGLPVVQTLHDFELLSAGSLDARGGAYDADESKLSYRIANSLTFPVRRLVHARRVSRFVAVSRFLARIYASHGIHAEVIQNFAPVSEEQPAPMPFSERTGISFVGRLTREKGALDMIEVARRLPAVPVVLVGSGSLATEVQKAASELPNVTMTGFLRPDEVRRVVAASRLLVAPSRCHEAASNVALEAMTQGTPVVAYPSGGLAEYVADSGCGLVVPSDPASLAFVVSKTIVDEPAWTSMSHAGLAAVAETHSRSRYGERIEHVYENAVSGPTD